MLTTAATRQSVRDLDKRFTGSTGSVDLLAVFDALRPYPDQTRRYIDASREMRAELRALKPPSSAS